MALELFISSEIADLYPDEGIVLRNKILGELGLNNSFISFTKDFSFPATNRNNKLLSHFENKANENISNPNQSITARIEIDKNLSLDGDIELLSVTWKNGKPYNYKIVFYSSSSSLKSEFGEALLTDVDLSEFEFTISLANIYSSWSGGLNTGKVYVPIMSHSRWYRWYSAASSSGHPDDIAGAATGVLLKEQRVGLRLIDFVQALGNHIDKTFSFDAKISTYLNEAFIIPSKAADVLFSISDELYLTDVQSAVGTPINCTTSYATMPFVQENLDPNNNWTTGNTYTPTFNGTYTFNVEFNSANSPQVRDARNIRLWDIGAAASLTSDALNAISGVFTLSANLTAGSTYRLEWAGVKATNTLDVRMITTVVPVNIFGLTYSPINTMPVVKAIDFLSGFLSAFNLLIIPSDVNQYTITDMFTLYDDGEILNLSNYVDHKLLTYEKVNVNDLISFKHKTGEDAPNVLFAQERGREYADLEFIPNVDYSDGALEKESIFNVFPPAYISTYDNKDLSIGTTDIWHHFQLSNDSPPKPVLANFLLLYRNDIETTSFPYYIQNGVNSSGNPTYTLYSDYSRYSQVQDDISLISSNTLSYSLENPFIGAPAEGTITNEFFLDWIAQLYKRTAYTIDVSFPANLGLYSKINTFSIIYFNNFYHFITEYSYDTGKNIMTLKLMRHDNVSITSTETKGIIKT